MKRIDFNRDRLRKALVCRDKDERLADLCYEFMMVNSPDIKRSAMVLFLRSLSYVEGDRSVGFGIVLEPA